MEQKIGLSTGEILTIAAFVIGFIIWLVRLENKTNQNQEDLDCHIEDDFNELKKGFRTHEQNENIHHNAKAFEEFKTSITNKFQAMERSVEKVGDRMENGLRDVSRKLEDFIEKRR